MVKLDAPDEHPVRNNLPHAESLPNVGDFDLDNTWRCPYNPGFLELYSSPVWLISRMNKRLVPNLKILERLYRRMGALHCFVQVG